MEKLQNGAHRPTKNHRVTDWHAFCNKTGMEVKKTCGVKSPTHIDAGRLLDVIDGLQALSETESRHLTRCKHCLETARLAAREVVRRRRELRLEETRGTAVTAFYR